MKRPHPIKYWHHASRPTKVGLSTLWLSGALFIWAGIGIGLAAQWWDAWPYFAAAISCLVSTYYVCRAELFWRLAQLYRLEADHKGELNRKLIHGGTQLLNQIRRMN